MSADDTLDRLADVIASRRGADPDRSYVARLFSRGEDAMLKKVGEEATELVLAAKDAARDAAAAPRLVAETADLWFHTLIVLAAHGLGPDAVLAELRRREGLSGLEEFARRADRGAPPPPAGQPAIDPQTPERSPR